MSRADLSPESRRRASREEARRRVHRRRRVLALAAVALLLIAVIWLIGSCGSDGQKPDPGPTPEEIQAATERKAAQQRARCDIDGVRRAHWAGFRLA